MKLWADAKKILCLRLDTMGDILMTTPAFRALKESPQRPKLTLLTSKAGVSVAPLIPEIDNVMVYEAPWMKATLPRFHSHDDFSLIESLRKEEFDAAVIFTVYSQNPLAAAYVCFLA